MSWICITTLYVVQRCWAFEINLSSTSWTSISGLYGIKCLVRASSLLSLSKSPTTKTISAFGSIILYGPLLMNCSLWPFLMVCEQGRSRQYGSSVALHVSFHCIAVHLFTSRCWTLFYFLLHVLQRVLNLIYYIKSTTEARAHHLIIILRFARASVIDFNFLCVSNGRSRSNGRTVWCEVNSSSGVRYTIS